MSIFGKLFTSNTMYVPRWNDLILDSELKKMLQQRAAVVPPPTLLLTGRPGVGKTVVAMAYATNGNARKAYLWHGDQIKSVGLVYATLQRFPVVVIDDAHLMPSKVWDGLYTVIQPAGQRYFIENGRTRKINATIVATSNKPLPDAVMRRFAIKLQFDKYSPELMAGITAMLCKRFNVQCTEDLLRALQTYARGVPSVVENLLEAMRGLPVTTKAVQDMARQQGMFSNGLRHEEVQYLLILARNGGKAGLQMIKSMMPATDVNAVEVELQELGYIERTTTGRVITSDGISALEQVIGEIKNA